MTSRICIKSHLLSFEYRVKINCFHRTRSILTDAIYRKHNECNEIKRNIYTSTSNCPIRKLSLWHVSMKLIAISRITSSISEPAFLLTMFHPMFPGERSNVPPHACSPCEGTLPYPRDFLTISHSRLLFWYNHLLQIILKPGPCVYSNRYSWQAVKLWRGDYK